MEKRYTNPRLEIAKQFREDRNKFLNEKYFPRIPTEDKRWTQEELDALDEKRNKERPPCKFGASCDRLQCPYSHPIIRIGICKDFRWCDDPKCVKIHPTQKLLDYLDYTEPMVLLEQGFTLP